MRHFTSPVSQFRYDLQRAGDKPIGFEGPNGHIYQMSSIYGETDLLPCPNHCKLQSGFYALCSPREHPQEYLEIVYQCSYCDHMIVRVYVIKQIKTYTNEEIEFIGRLVNDIMITRSEGDPGEYEKRKKSDIWKKKTPVNEEKERTPKLKKILKEGPINDLKIKLGSEEYEIASLFGETNVLPCSNSCYMQKGIYAVVSPKTEEQPIIQILYQCEICEDLTLKEYDIRDLNQYSEDEYNFVVVMMKDVFIPRGKLGALELAQRRKIDILVDKVHKTYRIVSNELKLD